MLNVSVGDAPAELRAAVLAMKRADRFVRNDVNDRMRSTMGPVWRQEVQAKSANSRVAHSQEVLSANARFAGGNPGQLVTAASKKKIGRGLIPDQHWAGYEYGAARNAYSAMTSKKGTSYKRRTKRHLSQRVSQGFAIEPAVVEVLPRIAAFYAQSVVKAFMDAADESF